MNKKKISKPKYSQVSAIIPSSVEVKKYETSVKTLKDNSSGTATVFGSTLLIGLHPVIWSGEVNMAENPVSY